MAGISKEPVTDIMKAQLKKEQKKRKSKERKEKKKSKKQHNVDEGRAHDFKSPSESHKPTREDIQDMTSPALKRSLMLSSEDRPNERSKKRKIQSPTSTLTNSTQEATSRHPFEVDEADHCETPWRAYQDIIPVLDQIAQSLGKTLKDLKIYDPYYCDGGVRRKLNSLGCHKVINANRDFYQDIESDSVPLHDVVVTNPPYSGHHVESLLKFVSNNCARTGKKKRLTPFLLLLPHYVYTKPYFLDYFESDARGLPKSTTSPANKTNNLQKLFYLVPKNNFRYSYEPPSWVSPETGSSALSKGKTQTAPFPTFWYCLVPSLMSSSSSSSSSSGWLSETFGQSGQYVAASAKNKISGSASGSGGSSSTLHYASCTSHLPREFKGEFDITNKRPNPRARKRAAQKKQQQRKETSEAGAPMQMLSATSTNGGKRRKKKRY